MEETKISFWLDQQQQQQQTEDGSMHRHSWPIGDVQTSISQSMNIFASRFMEYPNEFKEVESTNMNQTTTAERLNTMYTNMFRLYDPCHYDICDQRHLTLKSAIIILIKRAKKALFLIVLVMACCPFSRSSEDVTFVQAFPSIVSYKSSKVNSEKAYLSSSSSMHLYRIYNDYRTPFIKTPFSPVLLYSMKNGNDDDPIEEKKKIGDDDTNSEADGIRFEKQKRNYDDRRNRRSSHNYKGFMKHGSTNNRAGSTSSTGSNDHEKLQKQHQNNAGNGVFNSNTQSDATITTTTAATTAATSSSSTSIPTANELQIMQRLIQLENLVASQQVTIRKLNDQCRELSETTNAFTELIKLLSSSQRLDKKKKNTNDMKDGTGDSLDTISSSSSSSSSSKSISSSSRFRDKNGIDGSDMISEYEIDDEDDDLDDDDEDEDIAETVPESALNSQKGIRKGSNNYRSNTETIIEAYEDSNIFGTAPQTVLEAADIAGASILSGILAGHQRMLVDVRDAELNSSIETFVQFLELAVLPVAAGLEGLRGPRNRLKIVFPTVSELLQYRKIMCLSAPEVVTLSTLGFDPVENQDNVVVIIAPKPDDEEGLQKMNELLVLPPPPPSSSSSSSSYDYYDSEGKRTRGIAKPIIVLNRHMMPVTGPAAKFEVAYHLRLLSVQYMSGEAPTPLSTILPTEKNTKDDDDDDLVDIDSLLLNNTTSTSGAIDNTISADQRKREFEAVIKKHMQEQKKLNMSLSNDDIDHHAPVPSPSSTPKDGSTSTTGSSMFGSTRAMVIRAYPYPWNVFVDTSPDDSASDFEVAAVFSREPVAKEIHDAIVTCLEGSDYEDEIVAYQMQQAFEDGQLDRIAELFSHYIMDDTKKKDDEEDIIDVIDENENEEEYFIDYNKQQLNQRNNDNDDDSNYYLDDESDDDEDDDDDDDDNYPYDDYYGSNVLR